MLQSTHVYISNLFKRKLRPREPSVYYLGGSVPDVRYFAGIPRQWSHFPREQLTKKFPKADKDFLLGYDLHLALDEFTLVSDVRNALVAKFPFPVRRYLSGSAIEVLIGMYCMSKLHPGEEIVLSKNYQSDLSRIGVEQEPLSEFVLAVQKMVDSRSEGVFGEIMMGEPRFRENERISKLHRAGTYIDDHKLVQRYLLSTARPHIENFIGEFEAEFDSSL